MMRPSSSHIHKSFRQHPQPPQFREDSLPQQDTHSSAPMRAPLSNRSPNILFSMESKDASIFDKNSEVLNTYFQARDSLRDSRR